MKNNSFRKVSTSRAAIGRTERAGCEKRDLSMQHKKVSTSRAAIGRTERAGCNERGLSMLTQEIILSKKVSNLQLHNITRICVQMRVIFLFKDNNLKYHLHQKAILAYHFPNVILAGKLSIITAYFPHRTAKKLNIEKFP